MAQGEPIVCDINQCIYAKNYKEFSGLGVFVSKDLEKRLSLFGKHGGQLEFVKLEMVTNMEKKCVEVHLIFTDHDVRSCKDAPEDELYYRVVVPYTEENVLEGKKNDRQVEG